MRGARLIKLPKVSRCGRHKPQAADQTFGWSWHKATESSVAVSFLLVRFSFSAIPTFSKTLRLSTCLKFIQQQKQHTRTHTVERPACLIKCGKRQNGTLNIARVAYKALLGRRPPVAWWPHRVRTILLGDRRRAR